MARFYVEADGGSRGNPGPAGYGSLLIDSNGVVIAERAEAIGVATNNVAEYRGLISALGLALEHAPGADLEVRMDSKLVIEQMAGRWKIKHPDMKPLALEAQQLARQFPRVTWTWIPREQNTRADALANKAMDGQPVVTSPAQVTVEQPVAEQGTLDEAFVEEDKGHGWLDAAGPPTTLTMVRHGVTDETVRKIFSGSGGMNPPLNERGRQQAERAAAHLAAREPVDLIISSPLRRTLDTAGVLASRLDVPIVEEPGFAEAAFGEWDGYTFLEIQERWPDELAAWLASPDVAPPGGESFAEVRRRVEEARRRMTLEHPGKRLVVASHVTPIKLVVREALDVSMVVLRTLDVAPASITTATWWPDDNSVLRSFSIVP